MRVREPLRPFFKLYGGKWRLAPTYPAPEHETLVEPFSGAAGYSTRHPDRRVVLVEKDPTIAALWRYLIRVSPGELLRVPVLEPGQAVCDLRGCAEEARVLVGFWLSSAPFGPRSAPSAWMREYAGSERFWCASVRSRIAAQLGRIRHWSLIEGSYESAPNVEATWFVDPPYEVAGTLYGTKFREHRELAAWCAARRGLVIVCENEGATWLPFRPHAVAGGVGGADKISREVVCVLRDGVVS